MKIALVSLNQVWKDKEKNYDQCVKYVDMAADRQLDLIIFPEMTLTGFTTDINEISEDKDSLSIEKFKELSKLNNIAIVVGIVIKDNNKALNKSIFISRTGDIIGEYSKMHPFSFAGEDKYFNGGNEIVSVEFDNFNIGLTVCYDLRFPELYSALSKKSNVIINIANWPEKRVDHWNTLLKARAIENQVFVIGVNRIGKDGNGLEYKESSAIYNANGEILISEKIENMKIFNMNLEANENFIKLFSTIKDRKTLLYKEIL